MSQFDSFETMEQAHSAYNACTEELADALTEAKNRGRRTPEQLKKIAAINKRCDELMHAYLDAFKKCYGEGTQEKEQV